VRAVFDHGSLMKHNDLIGMRNGGQPVPVTRVSPQSTRQGGQCFEEKAKKKKKKKKLTQ
jgi:hypothetical protein